MTWDVFDCQFLRLGGVENADALVSPKVKDFNCLTLGWDDSDLFKVELKFTDVDFFPVNYHCDDISTRQ